MWPIKRKKKSSRKDLKQVYFYKNDYTILKGLSKEQKRSLTQTAHDIMMIYFGYQQGTKESQIQMLTLERNVASEEMKRLRKELDLYIEWFGKIPKSDSKSTQTENT